MRRLGGATAGPVEARVPVEVVRSPADADARAEAATPPAEGDHQGPARIDMRLVPAAIGVWLGSLVGLLWGWWAAGLAGGVAVLVGTLALRGRVVGSRFAGSLSRRRTAAVALLGCGVALLAVVSPRLLDAQHDPLTTAAAHGKGAELRVTALERPRPVHSAGYAGQQGGTRSVVLESAITTASVDGRPVSSEGRVLLVAPVERWSRLLPGQTATVSATLAPARPTELSVAVAYARGSPEEVDAAPWWQRAAASMRAALRHACAVLAPEAAGLLPGLVVGDTSELAPRVEREFLDSGLSHLTAVSGSNVVIVCGAALLLLRLLRCGPRSAAVGAGLVLVAFVILVGPEPSVLRAGVMGGVGLLAVALGRKGSALPALCAAVCVLVLYDSAMAVSFGFALSAVATAALVMLAPGWSGAMARRGVPVGIAESLAVPLAAFLVTAPIIGGMAGKLSLVSVFANVLAAPVIALVTILGALAAVAAPLCSPAAHALVHLAGPEVHWLILVARECASVPGGVLNWPDGWWGGLLAALAASGLVLALRHNKLRIVLAAVVVVVLLVLVPTQVVAPDWPPRRWALVACDVGQGDALILTTGEPGRAVVVDTGPEPGPVDECLDRLGIERVPLVLLTHLHADHIGGLSSVFEGRSVGAVAVGPGRRPNWAWHEVADSARAHGVPLLELGAGRTLAWPDLTMNVLGPHYVAPVEDQQGGTDINNTSVVVGARTSAGRVLLTGDVELAAQGDLLANSADLRADILKVPHHGSRYSLPQFLAAVAPRVALVSVGVDNRYGHPNKRTLDTLGGSGALVARTDTDGDTAVVADEAGPAIVRRGVTNQRR